MSGRRKASRKRKKSEITSPRKRSRGRKKQRVNSVNLDVMDEREEDEIKLALEASLADLQPFDQRNRISSIATGTTRKKSVSTLDLTSSFTMPIDLCETDDGSSSICTSVCNKRPILERADTLQRISAVKGELQSKMQQIATEQSHLEGLFGPQLERVEQLIAQSDAEFTKLMSIVPILESSTKSSVSNSIVSVSDTDRDEESSSNDDACVLSPLRDRVRIELQKRNALASLDMIRDAINAMARKQHNACRALYAAMNEQINDKQMEYNALDSKLQSVLTSERSILDEQLCRELMRDDAMIGGKFASIKDYWLSLHTSASQKTGSFELFNERVSQALQLQLGSRRVAVNEKDSSADEKCSLDCGETTCDSTMQVACVSKSNPKKAVGLDLDSMTSSASVSCFVDDDTTTAINSMNSGLSNEEGSDRDGGFGFGLILDDASRFECSICIMDDLPIDSMMCFGGCYHVYCVSCVRMHLEMKLKQRNVCGVRCMADGCSQILTNEEIQLVMSEERYREWDSLVLQLTLTKDPNARFCPAPDCGMAMYGDKESPMLECPKCKYHFCFNCGTEEWHTGVTCEAFKQWKIDNGQADVKFEEWREKHKKKAKPCPQCKSLIEKNGGCNHMTCTNCKYEWHWETCGKWKGYDANYGAPIYPGRPVVPTAPPRVRGRGRGRRGGRRGR